MEDAVNGRWYKGVGVELFEKIEAALGKIDIIAEDLGYIDDGVISLLAETGFPGMKILQFAFDSRENSRTITVGTASPISALTITTPLRVGSPPRRPRTCASQRNICA